MSGYRCIVIDPPWPEYGGGGRGAQRHYSLLRVPEIAKVILRSPMWLPADDAHCWVWTTDTYLPSALGLIETLGFRYVRTFVWVKMTDELYRGASAYQSLAVAETSLQIGLGQYARGSHEFCLFGARGASMVPAPKNRPPSVLFAPKQEHSRKPDTCFTEWFERVSPGPGLEMFARTPRPGWDSWGNQIDKFSPHIAGSEGAV